MFTFGLLSYRAMVFFSNGIFLGLAGLPRRYYSNTAFPMFEGLTDINEIITFFAIVGGIVQVLFIFNFFYSIFYGTKAQRTLGDLQPLNGQHQ